MKQIIQSLKTGSTKVTEVPVPSTASRALLIKTSKTLISTGTERMLIEFGRAGLIKKASQQPEKVKIVLDKVFTDGLKPTIEAVFNKIDQPLPLGYCNVGLVHEVGSTVTNFKKGDRVVSNGKHAEVVNVPINLCAKVPDVVSDEEASFTVLGAVALQGIRLVKPTLGESVVVIGLGLVGLMTVQLLKANGCRVLGLDFDQNKLSLAKKFGAELVDLNKEDPLAIADIFSRGRGVDGVIITASTTSDKPMHQAAQMCRKRGRIVLVGVTGLKLSRDDFFKKELTLQVSASYGPGRYDSNYEEKGQDYPIGFVRWTEQRNFEAVLDMMATGALDVKQLISHRYDINEAEKAYKVIINTEPSLGILLTYPGIELTEDSRKILLSNNNDIKKLNNNDIIKKIKVSFLGSGNYAASVLIPAFKAVGVELKSVASNTGVSGVHVGQKYGFLETTTDSDHLFNDGTTDAVVIATRHNSHAGFVLKALKKQKHVFVEKPLCLTLDELNKIESTYSSLNILMVGFNRRFAPQVQKMKMLLDNISGPKTMIMTINAGKIPNDHWTQDLEVGGGRIIGEACHFIDLLRFLVGKTITNYQIQFMDSSTKDTANIQLSFEDGSIGTIHYYANGSKSFPKERLEVFAGGGVLQLDNYRKLVGFGWPGFKKMNLWQQDKGQKACVKAFIDAISKGSTSPIPVEEIFEVSRISIKLLNQ
ncbi:bi-domain-containing oxidoreductase [Candidatus Pelagibacter sp.]|nr:bi-domain-containing oxidoreductase [Candidatus Pelagibacter sp.]|tara:strand:+ start:194 stop:2305 length:2112 start_codon:yes stop_codon:yes gene_type:complete